MRTLLSRCLPATLALLIACAKAAGQPAPPLDRLHYPAWIATWDDQLLVVSLDQDLSYDSGSLVAFNLGDAPPSATVQGGIQVPNVAGMLRVPTPDELQTCRFDTTAVPSNFALVAGRTEDVLVMSTLNPGAAPSCPAGCRIPLSPFSATLPFGVGLSCSPNDTADHKAGAARAWVSYEEGRNDTGYVTQVDLSGDTPVSQQVQVNIGAGTPRSFANDPAHDRLYIPGKEHDQSAPIRWIDVGNGCKSFDDNDGIQDETRGGCHVDPGFDLGLRLRGAEPNDIQLSSQEWPCTSGGYSGNCRRAYLSVRIYDADAASYLGGRPSLDIGGMLVVLELPESGLGRPDPQWVNGVDIGQTAGSVVVIPRPGKPDLVAVAAVEDDLLWIYDDEVGAMVKVFGRAADGVPLLGHKYSGLTSRDLGNGTVRLFVSSFEDDWVSAVDVPLAAPASAAVVPDPVDPTRPWHIQGVVQ